MKKTLFYWYGWLFVRPRRWLFGNMIRATRLIWLPRKEWYGWVLPNIHWHILYKTIFNFCHWLADDGWRPICDWTGGYRRTFPWIAQVIKRIGDTTAGVHISNCIECWHCGAEGCDQTTLSEDETGATFILKETWTCATQDGTDYCFRGTTICPRCGYEEEYQDGSL